MLTLVKRQGLLVAIGCNLCRTSRHYDPDDLRLLFGDIDVDTVERRIRCEACDKQDYVTVRTWRPVGSDWRGLVIRRLVRVETVRRPVWRDEQA
ncbi:hypothetical protein [Aureimonas leprariae]|uniref:Uncharacterized protein n=1 Tax=Plantimonas leprariae TaxID=2615207 RepID=A0A7V7TWN1_9HYPH|nr:hypothetical protein [Aureimonas leprariae]KAB0680173.1 hypothetical protein F6X38_08260 [Aureimonas leprariae]